MTSPTPAARQTPSRRIPAPTLSATQRRWRIRYQQLRDGHEPCFMGERRYTCREFDCPWRSACLAMRADWQR